MAKKKPTFINNYPLAENYEHVYQGQVQTVTVAVHINYKEGYISLIDPNPANPAASHNNGKQWIFKKRELEYMQGWQDILSAMKSAIADATEKLKGYQELQEKRKEAEIQEAAELVANNT